MSQEMKIVIIGGGNMGFAYAKLFLDEKLVLPANLTIIQRNGQRTQELTKLLNCKISEQFSELQNADYCLICVKPKDWAALSLKLITKIQSETCIISVMAGITISKLKATLGDHEKIIRCMPNLAIQVQQGVTAYYPDKLSYIEENAFTKLFAATGTLIRVEEESLLDATTAVSGSGTAYVCYFMEAMTAAAISLGFSKQQAEIIIHQTFVGVLTTLNNQGIAPVDLRQKVTSGGGTTEAAVKYFIAHQTKQQIVEAIFAAHKRAKELND